MDHYESAYEKLKNVDSKRENVDLDDFEEFMRKVEEVNKMVHALTSNNKSEIEEATQNATVWLKTHKREKRCAERKMVEDRSKGPSENMLNKSCNRDGPKKKIYDKTVFNKKAFNEEKRKEGLNNLNCETMSQEAFMKSVEEDARKRTEERKQSKIKSDELKENAKKAFLLKDYEKALDWFNKAIEVRKDSSLLYTNRALTLLNLGLNKRALDDCETALKLNNNHFKAVVYKGKAYFQMAEEEKAEEWMTEAKKMFPDREREIEDYQKSWYTPSENEEF